MKILKRSLIGIGAIVVVLVIALLIYSRNPYTALDAMTEAIEELDLSAVTITEDRDEIRYTVDNPVKQILFIPGGLVTPDSYEYLAASLAMNGYNVTIFKPLVNLAILTPNYATKFLSEELDNVVIGHSLGGVVASIFSSGNKLIDQVVLLGSYPIKDLTDKEVLLITAEFDAGMDPEKFEDSLDLVASNTVIYNILGGNHAQFGWYGPQDGDGEATLTTLVQQEIVITEILNFIN